MSETFVDYMQIWNPTATSLMRKRAKWGLTTEKVSKLPESEQKTIHVRSFPHFHTTETSHSFRISSFSVRMCYCKPCTHLFSKTWSPFLSVTLENMNAGIPFFLIPKHYTNILWVYLCKKKWCEKELHAGGGIFARFAQSYRTATATCSKKTN